MQTTTNKKQNLIEMFIDRTSGESYAQNRLTTRETDSGSVALIAYNWLKIAEYDERREAVTVFTGHKQLGSTTVTRYINDVQRVAQERRDVIITGESPVVGKPNEGAKFIGEYVDFTSRLSAVEEKAVNTVIESLRFI